MSPLSRGLRIPAQRGLRTKRMETLDQATVESFMRLALEEAAKGLGRTSPNPTVGAVLVRQGRILARGYHKQAGTAHAEVVALEAAGVEARGADLYTTLEPCDHFGRTPPCSMAILDAGVRRVICGSSDPNPLVNGKGVERLRKAGVPVLTGVLKDEADALNRPFFKHVTTGMPYVTLKAAITLDGKIATATGDSRWVTGSLARERVHRLRDQVDAILVGANTVRLDNPQLTTRLPDGTGRDAVRVILDSQLRLPLDRAVFAPGGPRTIVATRASLDTRKARALAARGVEVWTFKGPGEQVALGRLLQRLAKAGLLHILCEGGARLYARLLKEKRVDEFQLFIAPKLIGEKGLSWTGDLGVREMAKALMLSTVSVENVGGDLLVLAKPLTTQG